MSEEFKLLNKLYKDKKLSLRFKNSSDPFGVWLYWVCKLNPSALNLYGYAFYIYFLLTMDWLWLPLSIFVGFKYGWYFGLGLWIIHHILQKSFFSRIGQGLITRDALKTEDTFDAFWENNSFLIASISKKKSHEISAGLPEVIIYPPNDWRFELNQNQHNLLD